VKLLVGVDFSPAKDVVLACAKALVTETAGRIWLVHVAMPDPSFVGYSARPDVARQTLAERFRREHRELQALAADLRAEDIQVTGLLIQGMTAQTLLRQADLLDVDMIVVGTHGGGFVRRVLLGSVSAGLVRQAQVPVVVVPSHLAGA